MVTKVIKMVVKAAWAAWFVLGIVAFVVTYAGFDEKSIPAGCPRLQRIIVAGAQDSTKAGVALFSFKELDAFGNKYPLTGVEQKAPIPVFVIVFLALVFLDINLGGPPVVKHRDH